MNRTILIATTLLLGNMNLESIQAGHHRIPDVVGLSHEDAANELRRKHFNVNAVEQGADQYRAGMVHSMSPGPGARLRSGATVTVYYFGVRQTPPPVQTVTVPDLNGRTQAEAEAILRAAGLGSSGFVSGSSNAQPGRVWNQQPAAGAQVQPGSAVTFMYYDSAAPAPQMVRVPFLSNYTRAQAEQVIRDAGLTPEAIPSGTDANRVGVVHNQWPQGNTEVQTGSRVQFYYYEGLTQYRLVITSITCRQLNDNSGGDEIYGIVSNERGSGMFREISFDREPQTVNPNWPADFQAGETMVFQLMEDDGLASTSDPATRIDDDVVGTIEVTGQMPETTQVMSSGDFFNGYEEYVVTYRVDIIQ